MNKAYGVFELKSYDDDSRIVKGVASTINPDRADDIMEPSGAKFNLPMPLLSQHEHHLPIGFVKEAEVKDDRIEITAEVSKDTGLEYIETAWKQLKAKLVRGLSIGFIPLEYNFIKDSYGIHVLEWEWFELSAVTIPANAEALITTIKAYDQDPSMRSQVINALSGGNPRMQKALDSIKDAKRVLNMRAES
jgi:HK97 family phage prohead protease